MQYEETFAEDEGLPEYIESDQLNKFIFNEQTIDLVLQDLMERGIKIQGGDCLGKSIIFAQNKRHAEFIVTRFNKLYPKFNGKFARRIICDDSYAQTLIEDFKDPIRNHILQYRWICWIPELTCQNVSTLFFSRKFALRLSFGR